MVKVLLTIAEDTEADPDVRRKAACDLLDRANGRPESLVTQRGNAPAGPLVALNFASASRLSPEECYARMVAGTMPIDPSVFEPAALPPGSTEAPEANLT